MEEDNKVPGEGESQAEGGQVSAAPEATPATEGEKAAEAGAGDAQGTGENGATQQ